MTDDPAFNRAMYLFLLGCVVLALAALLAI